MPKKSKTKKARASVKSTVKYLSISPNDRITRSVLSSAPSGVVRAIANAALNAQQNPGVVLSPSTRDLFRTYSKSFDFLTRRDRSVEQKRNHILQKGGALPIIVPLLASVLGSLGSAVISRVFNRSEES